VYQKANQHDYVGCIPYPWESISVCRAPAALWRAAGPHICKETKSFATLRELSFKIRTCFDGEKKEVVFY